MSTVTCARCRRTGPAFDEPPYPGELGREIRDRVCSSCWTEWQQAEVMVINELRLDFMDPRSAEILEQQMREFFGLGATPPQAE